MIIKNIAKICRESLAVRIYRSNGGEQWIGTSAAMYYVPNLPPLTVAQACEIFDYKQKIKNAICERPMADTSDAAELFVDDYPHEIYIEELPQDIAIRGDLYKVFSCQGVNFLINDLYLAPLADIGENTIYCMRLYKETPILCIKNGMVAAAVIAPRKFTREIIDDEISSMENVIAKLRTEHIVAKEISEDVRQMRMEDTDDE